MDIGWYFYDDKLPATSARPKKKKTKVAIAPELSDIIIYTQAIKFKGIYFSFIYCFHS